MPKVKRGNERLSHRREKKSVIIDMNRMILAKYSGKRVIFESSDCAEHHLI